MKKLLVFMVVGFGGAMLVKGGHVTISPSNQIMIAGFPVPLPESVQNSPVVSVIAAMVRLPSASLTTVADTRAEAAQPTRPPAPSVTSAATTYNPNTPNAGQANSLEQLSTVARTIRP
jgi:hypothetical protein